MRTVLCLLAAILIILSINGCREVPQVSSSRSDSTIIIRESVPFYVKGGQARTALNLDTLRKLYGSGSIERYYTITEKNGNAKLSQRIDLLTGQLQSICSARDTVYIFKTETIERYRSDNKTVQLPGEKLTTAKKIKLWIFNNFFGAIMVVIVLLGMAIGIKHLKLF